MRNFEKGAITYLVVFAVLLVFGAAGSADAEHAQREFRHYCYMVDAGHWPDYKGSREACVEEFGPRLASNH